MPGERLAPSAPQAEFFLPADKVAELQVNKTLDLVRAREKCTLTAAELRRQLGRHSLVGYQVGNVTEPALTPFLVPRDHANRTDAAVVVVPGGGTHHMSWESQGSDAARWLNSLGVAAFVLRYRTPSTAWHHQSQIMDVQRAVSLVRSKAESLGINASRIGLFGSGDGAQLALYASSALRLFYEPVDQAEAADPGAALPNFNILLGPTFPGDWIGERQRAISAANNHEPMPRMFWNITQVPPTFIAAVGDDECVTPAETTNIHRYLHPGRNLTELHLYPTGGNSFDFCYRLGKDFMLKNEVCMWTDRAETFIDHAVLRRASNESEDFFWKLRKLVGGPMENTGVTSSW